jgi:hypothetical protein
LYSICPTQSGTWYRCLRTSVLDPKQFVSDSVSDSGTDSARLVAFICVLVLVRQRKKFYNRKIHRFFSVRCSICDLKQNLFHESVNPNSYPNFFIRIRIRPNFTDSFGFGSTTLLRTGGPVPYRHATGTCSEDMSTEIFKKLTYNIFKNLN